jgi:hypothetical protein
MCKAGCFGAGDLRRDLMQGFAGTSPWHDLKDWVLLRASSFRLPSVSLGRLVGIPDTWFSSGLVECSFGFEPMSSHVD